MGNLPRHAMNCVECGNRMVRTRPDADFCSSKCRQKAYRDRVRDARERRSAVKAAQAQAQATAAATAAVGGQSAGKVVKSQTCGRTRRR